MAHGSGRLPVDLAHNPTERGDFLFLLTVSFKIFPFTPIQTDTTFSIPPIQTPKTPSKVIQGGDNSRTFDSRTTKSNKYRLKVRGLVMSGLEYTCTLVVEYTYTSIR